MNKSQILLWHASLFFCFSLYFLPCIKGQRTRFAVKKASVFGPINYEISGKSLKPLPSVSFVKPATIELIKMMAREYLALHLACNN